MSRLKLALVVVASFVAGVLSTAGVVWYTSPPATCDRGNLTACYLDYRNAEHRFLDHQGELVRVMRDNP
jgi:hypothetical protein